MNDVCIKPHLTELCQLSHVKYCTVCTEGFSREYYRGKVQTCI